ncbi:hypothetical protein LSH36_276g01035 [Paralvinella palmiformis]|uniref:Uncharacterized protein n=1 Tax=Paralvinella palmiformis TaxID=53620 RepID=A0AAD9N3X2_9ANNE|nr:hypothetical protein LSH36_276g01035 [Paralvinella palmiformis]
MNSLVVDTSDEEDYTLVATESPLPDDCTGGAEHVHGNTVDQSSLVSVLIDPPTIQVLVENVDVGEPVQIGAADADVLSDVETPIRLPHIEIPVPAPRRTFWTNIRLGSIKICRFKQDIKKYLA